MSEVSAQSLSPDALIARHRRAYFFIQLGYVLFGAAIITVTAQFFPHNQLMAMVIAALCYDAFRIFLIFALSQDDDLEVGMPSNRQLVGHFILSTPRGWLNYALLALPANAALTYLNHDITSLENVGTYTLGVLQGTVALILGDISNLRASLASLVMDLGVVGVIEYIAVRWVFAKRKIFLKKDT